MALHAEYPSDVLVFPESSFSRMRNSFCNEDKLVIPAAVHAELQNLTMLQQQQALEESGQLLFPQTFPGSAMQGVATCGAIHHAADTELNVNIWNNRNNNITENTARKRLRESTSRELLGNPNVVSFDAADANNNNTNNNVNTTAATPFNMPESNGLPSVSTGLRLSLEDVNSTNRMELNNHPPIPNANATNANNAPSSFAQKLSAEMQRQRSDIDDLVKLEAERLKQMLHERTERYSKILLCAAAEGVSRKLREKDLQVMTVKRRNMELEAHIRNLLLESRAWQTRAESSEAVARALRMQIDEKSKEGSGDSEEDAVSMKMDENNVAGNVGICMEREQADLHLHGRCRNCSSSDVSILLWPCRHLCLCKTCEDKVALCPICASCITEKVQVFLPQ